MKNKIICGDCLEVMQEIRDGSIDLILTDPPYFIPSQTTAGTRDKVYKKSLADMSIMTAFAKNLFNIFDRILTEDGVAYVFCDSQSYPIFYREMFPFFKSVGTIIWDRMVGFNGYTWRRSHEIIAFGQRINARRIPTGDNDVIKCRGVLQKNRLHPVQKPQELLEKIIGKHQPKIVLDPFAGSGSTLLAAKKLGIDFIGIEMDEKYCKIAEERLKQKPLF